MTPDHETSWQRGFWSLIVTQFGGAFNDNALITYLATLVPNLGPALKIAVVAPMPSASVSTATAKNPGDLTMVRQK